MKISIKKNKKPDLRIDAMICDKPLSDHIYLFQPPKSQESMKNNIWEKGLKAKISMMN